MNLSVGFHIQNEVGRGKQGMWYPPVLSTCKKLQQEDHNSESRLDYNTVAQLGLELIIILLLPPE